MPYKDPELRKRKQAEYSKKHYTNNKEKVIKANGRRRRAMTAKFANFKATKSCIQCGESHPATLDFHHVERNKLNKKVHSLVSNGHYWDRIMEEIKKCVVLCSNCHRKHHHEERVEIKKKALAKKKKQSKI